MNDPYVFATRMDHEFCHDDPLKTFYKATVCVDGIECELHHFSDRVRQGVMYSGKAHAPTLKYQVATAISDGTIVHATLGIPGTQHDQNLLRVSGILDLLVPGERIVVDRGYLQANDQEITDKMIVGFVGHRTPAQEQWNKLVASVRIQVERMNMYFKKFEVFHYTRLKDMAVHSRLFHLACHLINWRIKRYPSRKAPHPNIQNAVMRRPL